MEHSRTITGHRHEAIANSSAPNVVGYLSLRSLSQAAIPRLLPSIKAVIEAQIRQLDADWVKTAVTHSADAWDAFYSDDAVVLPPNEKTLADKTSIPAAA